MWAILKGTLEGADYLVQRVRTYDEALSEIVQELPDAVLMDAQTLGDLRVAGSWYRETLLRTLHHDIDVIVLTGVSEQEAAGLFRAKADYLSKPIDSGQLLERIHKVLRHSRRARRKWARGSPRQLSAPVVRGAAFADWRLDMDMKKSLSRALNYLLFDESGASQALWALLTLTIMVVYLKLLPDETARQVSYFMGLVRLF